MAIESIGDIDISSLAGMSDDQAAALRILAGVGGFGERGVTGVPRFEEGVAALLDPAIEVGGGDLVGEFEQRIGGVEQLDGRLLVDDAFREAAAIESGSGAGNVPL